MIPIFPHPHQYNTYYFLGFFLFVFSFKIKTILVGLKWYRGFNLHFLLTSDVEHLFTCLLTIYVSYLEKCLFRSFAHLKNWLSFGCWVVKSYLYLLDTKPLLEIWFADIFLHTLDFLHFIDSIFWRTGVFNFCEIHFT